MNEKLKKGIMKSSFLDVSKILRMSTHNQYAGREISRVKPIDLSRVVPTKVPK